MSRIKDLEIRGIRNFGDENSKARIHFSKPLTLILGPNGTGKTTIIEALKYVTSGEYPPDSDRGKCFVHEPKLTLNHTVRGQVKGKIIDTKGQELVITRTMQVTRQKNDTLKFQAIDNTVTRIDENTKEKIQISSRCADIDREMLIAMGVSKPILNYVIFCHQEESNWPLEDGKKLKDKFDEIFDTSKYNKAMDITTKLIKDLQTELNEIRAYESGLKDIVDEVKSQEDKLRDCEKRASESKDRINIVNDSLIPINTRILRISQIHAEYQEIDEKLKKVETERKVAKNIMDSLQKHIKNKFMGSKEELIEKIECYDDNLSQKLMKKKKHEDELNEVAKMESHLAKKLANTRIELGSLRQKKFAFDEKSNRRNKLLMKALKIWKIPETDSTYTENGVNNSITLIESKINEFSTNMDNKYKECDQEERHVQEEVDNCRVNKTEIESEMSLTDKDKDKTVSDINIFRQQIEQASADNCKLSDITNKLQEATNQYEACSSAFNEKSIKDDLHSKIIDKKNLSSKLNLIDQEILSHNQQSSQQAELELHQNRLKEKQENIDFLKEKHRQNLDLLFDGDDIPQNRIKIKLETIQKSLFIEKTNLLNQIDEEQQKLTEFKTTLKHKENEVSKFKSELEGYKKKIALECEGNEYNEILLLQEKKVKALQDERVIFANQSLMYEEYLKQLRKKPCCPLCERAFQNAEEKKLEHKLNSEIKKSPESLKDCEKNLKKEQAYYDNLQQLKPLIETIKEIEEKKLPKTRIDLDLINKKLQQSDENVENLRLVLSEPEEKLSIYKSIIGDITLLDSYIQEKDTLNQAIQNKKREMLKKGKIGDRTMQEAQDERNVLKTEITSVENDIERLQLELQTGQENVQVTREKKNKLNEEVLRIQHQMQSLSQIKAKLDESYRKKESYIESIKSLRHKLVFAVDELSSKEAELKNLKARNAKELEKHRNFKSTSQTELHELKIAQQEVQEFLNSKIDEKLCQTNITEENVIKECEKKKTERSKLEQFIRSANDECRLQETGKRELENNLELLEKEESVKELEIRIREYQLSLKNMQFDKLKKEHQQLQQEKDSYEKEIVKIKGAQEELENSITSFKRNLNQEKYRMARHNYKQKQLELTVQQEAILNLRAYVTVLDHAMIKFHEERMNTVNKIMGQLWSLVYSGNDTSSIQIRVKSTKGIGDKKRSYNYKLVQVKRSTEMDMKGKCSAGQKVLASIIIRMALAETFCSDCAVLALDEPTTNLDDENATNLAITLSKVIQLRAQHHKNFQLIVISHDEKFISHLSNLSGKQVFEELYRNIEGYSLVRRRDMSDYTKNSSQTVTDSKVVDDSDGEDEEQINMKLTKKRNLSMEDSPPHSSAAKKRAMFQKIALNHY